MADQQDTAGSRVRNCEHCGGEFDAPNRSKARGPQRFCSQSCGAAPRRKPPPAPPPDRQCSECSGSYSSPYPNRLTCSPVCAKRRGLRRSREQDSRDTSPRPCRECGIIFAPGDEPDGRRAFCSKRCSRIYGKRVERATRRARLLQLPRENVNPMAVFKRDGWRCYLCREPTPAKLRGTLDDRAPQLDHIIPLALGGSHTYANTACACRACNIAKGARMLDELAV